MFLRKMSTRSGSVAEGKRKSPIGVLTIVEREVQFQEGQWHRDKVSDIETVLDNIVFYLKQNHKYPRYLKYVGTQVIRCF